MNTSPQEQHIILLGFPSGIEAELACQQAERQGLHCRVLSWPELNQHSTVDLSKQSLLPIILGDWLDSPTLMKIMHWAADMGLCVQLVGDSEYWEKIVPLEKPEWVDMKIYPINSEWPNRFRHFFLENIHSKLLNGTHVYREAAILPPPLVDLNLPIMPSTKPILTNGSRVKRNYQHQTKKKNNKKKASFKTTTALLFSFLTMFMVVITLFSFYLYEKRETQHKIYAGSREKNKFIPSTESLSHIPPTAANRKIHQNCTDSCNDYKKKDDSLLSHTRTVSTGTNKKVHHENVEIYGESIKTLTTQPPPHIHMVTPVNNKNDFPECAKKYEQSKRTRSPLLPPHTHPSPVEANIEILRKCASTCEECKRRFHALTSPHSPSCPYCQEIELFPVQGSYRRTFPQWESGAKAGCNNCKRLLKIHQKRVVK